MRRPLTRIPTVGLMLAAAGMSLAGCRVLTDPVVNNTVLVTSLSLGICAGPAPTPQPGSVDCAGSIQLYVSMPVTSGWISVRMAFPDSTSFYTGEVQLTGDHPLDVIVAINNPYEASCVDTYATTVEVYDGHLNAVNARLLKRVPTTVHVTC